MKVYATMDDLTAEVRQLRDELERERAYARRLAADNARLRGLIKGAESDGVAESLHSSNCPWCSYAVGDWKRRHAPECPAFTEDGGVR